MKIRPLGSFQVEMIICDVVKRPVAVGWSTPVNVFPLGVPGSVHFFKSRFQKMITFLGPVPQRKGALSHRFFFGGGVPYTKQVGTLILAS